MQMREGERRMGQEGSQGRMGWQGEALAWSVADMRHREIRGGGGYSPGACGGGGI
jgi:hypothetical protein